MNNIIFVTITMGGGGSERAISILANQFINMGVQVTILMIAGNDIAYPLDKRIIIKQVGSNSNGSFFMRLKRIMKMRKCFKADKKANIIAMGSVASIFALLASIGLKNNKIISERNNPNRINGHQYSKKMCMIRDFLYNKANYCVFQTQDARDYFPKLSPNKTCVIPNSISNAIPEPYRGKRIEEIVTAGRLIPEKNHKMLIKAFSIFSIQFPDYNLKIYGDGIMEEELRNYIQELNLKEKIYILPFTNNLHQEIRKSGVYVSSSDGEGISNAILEAMAMGIPTIATDCPIGGSKMCIQQRENGILVQVGDAAMLADAMIEIVSDQEFADRISQNAVKVRETFSETTILNKWIQLLA